MSGWVVLMLLSGGLFAGGVGYFAWERIPAWRTMGTVEFLYDFERSIRRADRVQPLLLTMCLASTIGFSAGADGDARKLALSAAAGLLVTLLASGAILVPLQRRLIAGREDDVDRARRRWSRGHLARTAVGLASFVLLAAAAAA